MTGFHNFKEVYLGTSAFKFSILKSAITEIYLWNP